MSAEAPSDEMGVRQPEFVDDGADSPAMAGKRIGFRVPRVVPTGRVPADRSQSAGNAPQAAPRVDERTSGKTRNCHGSGRSAAPGRPTREPRWRRSGRRFYVSSSELLGEAASLERRTPRRKTFKSSRRRLDRRGAPRILRRASLFPRLRVLRRTNEGQAPKRAIRRIPVILEPIRTALERHGADRRKSNSHETSQHRHHRPRRPRQDHGWSTASCSNPARFARTSASPSG